MYNEYTLNELIDGNRLSVPFLETIINAIRISKVGNYKEEYVKLCGWQDDEMISIVIENFDDALECILSYLIRNEEYELCEELINVKHTVKI